MFSKLLKESSIEILSSSNSKLKSENSFNSSDSFNLSLTKNEMNNSNMSNETVISNEQEESSEKNRASFAIKTFNKIFKNYKNDSLISKFKNLNVSNSVDKNGDRPLNESINSNLDYLDESKIEHLENLRMLTLVRSNEENKDSKWTRLIKIINTVKLDRFNKEIKSTKGENVYSSNSTIELSESNSNQSTYKQPTTNQATTSQSSPKQSKNETTIDLTDLLKQFNETNLIGNFNRDNNIKFNDKLGDSFDENSYIKQISDKATKSKDESKEKTANANQVEADEAVTVASIDSEPEIDQNLTYSKLKIEPSKCYYCKLGTNFILKSKSFLINF